MKGLRLKKLGNYLEIDGELYEFEGVIHLKDQETMVMKPINKPKELLTRIDTISKILADKIDNKELMRTALLEMPSDSIEKVFKAIQKKKRVYQKHGCFEMHIGKEIIPLR